MLDKSQEPLKGVLQFGHFCPNIHSLYVHKYSKNKKVRLYFLNRNTSICAGGIQGRPGGFNFKDGSGQSVDPL